MTDFFNTESAKIYQFPVGGRAGLLAAGGSIKPAAVNVETVTGNDCWYHDEAVREADVRPIR